MNKGNPENIEFQKAIGRQLKSLRVLVGMTQTELAEKIGVRQATIISIEMGKYNTGIRQVYQIADALGYELTFTKRHNH